MTAPHITTQLVQQTQFVWGSFRLGADEFFALLFAGVLGLHAIRGIVREVRRLVQGV